MIRADLHSVMADSGAENRHARIKELRQEMSDSIAAGANPCPKCGTAPHGMLKTPETDKAPEQFEIGCIPCDGPDAPAARGWSIEQAVDRWNRGEFVVR